MINRELLAEYFSGLRRIPQLVRRLAFRTRTLEEELHEAQLRGNLRRALGPYDLIFMGFGITIGTGIWTLTGLQANPDTGAGPAVIISYLIAGLIVIIASCCYAELCMEYPLSGSSYTYLLNIFGELPAWIAVCCMLVTYVLGISANARVFTEYLGLLFAKDVDAFTITFGSKKPPYVPDMPCVNSYLISTNNFELDPIASSLILLLTIMLCYGNRESSYIMSTITIIKLFFVLFIMIAAYSVADDDNITAPQCFVQRGYQSEDSNCSNDTHAGTQYPLMYETFTYEVGKEQHKKVYNATGAQCYNEVSRHVFAPNGAAGILSAASLAIFTLTGFDSICNAAEEAQQLHHIPYAILGTTIGCTFLYFFISLSYVLMVDWNCGAFYDNRDPESADWNIGSYFGLAFCANGLEWMRYIVALVALLGSITVIGISLYSASRVVMVVARDWVLPSVLATVSTKTQTPVIAQVMLGLVSATLAFFFENETVYNVASFFSLVNLWMVVNALLMRRYYPETKKTYTRFGTVEVKTAMVRKNLLGMELSVRKCRFWVWFHIIMINIVSILAGVWLDVAKDNTMGDCCTAGYNKNLVDECCDQGIFNTTPSVLTDCCSITVDNSYLITFWALMGTWGLLTITMFLFCPIEYAPSTWHISNWLLPWLPSICILLLSCTAALMPWNESTEFGIVVVSIMSFILLFYLLYSLPMSYIKHAATDFANEEEANAVELVLVGGKWQHKNRYEDDLKNLRSQYGGAGDGTANGGTAAGKKKQSTILSPAGSGSVKSGSVKSGSSKVSQNRGSGGGGKGRKKGGKGGGKPGSLYQPGAIDTIHEKDEDIEQQQQQQRQQNGKDGGSDAKEDGS